MNYKEIVSSLQAILTDFAQTLPLEVFIFLGSFIEEIIAPIPSPFVTTLGGSVAAAKNYPVLMIFVLAVIAAIGKCIGSVVIYKVADISEDIILSRFGKLIGLSHSAVEKIGSQFHKGGKDWWILIGLRALPIVPSSPISAVCGLIKLPLKTFIVSSLIGSTIRNSIFLFFGYSGISAYSGVLSGLDSLESAVKIGGFAASALIIVWVLYKRRKVHKS